MNSKTLTAGLYQKSSDLIEMFPDYLVAAYTTATGWSDGGLLPPACEWKLSAA